MIILGAIIVSQLSSTCSKSIMKTPKLSKSFSCLYCLFWTDFTHCSGVFIVHFEQVNAIGIKISPKFINCLVGYSGLPAVLEFLELFLNCKWFLKNPWNNEFLRICSWNVPEFYISSFIKNSAYFFHYSSFWNWCLYVGSSYYFMILRPL